MFCSTKPLPPVGYLHDSRTTTHLRSRILLAALGSAADDFVIAGAQTMKFLVAKARGTKDADFILNVIALPKEPL